MTKLIIILLFVCSIVSGMESLRTILFKLCCVLSRLVLTANIEFSPYVIDLSNLDNGVYLLKSGDVVRVIGKY